MITLCIIQNQEQVNTIIESIKDSNEELTKKMKKLSLMVDQNSDTLELQKEIKDIFSNLSNKVKELKSVKSKKILAKSLAFARMIEQLLFKSLVDFNTIIEKVQNKSAKDLQSSRRQRR